MCAGYMQAINGLRGLAEGSDCSQGFGPNCRHALHFCAPASATFSQGLAVFLTYARSHPAQWHEPAEVHYLNAMSQAFPCNGEK
jgi:hypothetical protein